MNILLASNEKKIKLTDFMRALYGAEIREVTKEYIEQNNFYRGKSTKTGENLCGIGFLDEYIYLYDDFTGTEILEEIEEKEKISSILKSIKFPSILFTLLRYDNDNPLGFKLYEKGELSRVLLRGEVDLILDKGAIKDFEVDAIKEILPKFNESSFSLMDAYEEAIKEHDGWYGYKFAGVVDKILTLYISNILGIDNLYYPKLKEYKQFVYPIKEIKKSSIQLHPFNAFEDNYFVILLEKKTNLDSFSKLLKEIFGQSISITCEKYNNNIMEQVNRGTEGVGFMAETIDNKIIIGNKQLTNQILDIETKFYQKIHTIFNKPKYILALMASQHECGFGYITGHLDATPWRIRKSSMNKQNDSSNTFEFRPKLEVETKAEEEFRNRHFIDDNFCNTKYCIKHILRHFGHQPLRFIVKKQVRRIIFFEYDSLASNIQGINSTTK